jgi:uncharacterized membrane protein
MMGGADPKAQVQGPGIALIVIGVLMLIGQALYLVYTLLYAGLGAVATASGDSGGVGAIMGGVVGMILTIVWMLLSGVILFGGIKMKNMQSYGLAMASAIMAMLPCTTGYCCIFGLPIGIWALIVLMKPEVKASFR